MLSDYSSFKSQLILESVNESVVYYAPPLTNTLKSLKNPIAQDLLAIQGVDIKPDVTFIDIDKEGYLSFSTMKNGLKQLTDKYPEYAEGGHSDLSKRINQRIVNLLYGEEKTLKNIALFSKSRNPVKIGRLINTLLPGKYSAKEIEDFINQFKAVAYDNGEVFRLVSGDIISSWYSYSMYKEQSGTLGGSCMKTSSKSIFQIYTKNPEVCRLLILVENNELIGRALIWKITGIDNCEYFMDRQYVTKDAYVEKFRNYANEQGWAYKTVNNHSKLKSVTFKGNVFDAEMQIQLKHERYTQYPYMDTFKLYNPQTDILKNSEDDIVENLGCYILHDTEGGYDEVNDEVYSEFYDRYYPRESSTWSDRLEDWVPNHNIAEIEEGPYAGIWTDAHLDVSYDEYKDRWVHRYDSVESQAYGHRIWAEEAVNVVSEVYDSGSLPSSFDNWYYQDDTSTISKIDKSTLWFKGVSQEDSDWNNYEYIENSLIDKDYEANQILEIYSIYTYKVLIEIDAHDFYLHKDDAMMFDLKIDKNSKRKTDWFNYYKDVKGFKNKLSLFRDKPIMTMKKLVLKLRENEEDERLEFIKKYDVFDTSKLKVKELKELTTRDILANLRK